MIRQVKFGFLISMMSSCDYVIYVRVFAIANPSVYSVCRSGACLMQRPCALLRGLNKLSTIFLPHCILAPFDLRAKFYGHRPIRPGETPIFSISHYTRHLMMITALLLLQLEFWFECTQRVTFSVVFTSVIM